MSDLAVFKSDKLSMKGEEEEFEKVDDEKSMGDGIVPTTEDRKEAREIQLLEPSESVLMTPDLQASSQK